MTFMKMFYGPEFAVLADARRTTTLGSFSLAAGTSIFEFYSNKQFMSGVWGGGGMEADVFQNAGDRSPINRLIAMDLSGDRSDPEKYPCGRISLQTDCDNGQLILTSSDWVDFPRIAGLRVRWIPGDKFDKYQFLEYFDTT